MSKPLQWLLAIVVVSGPVSAAATGGDGTAASDAESRRCLRCHAMETLGYRDPATGEILRLSVDPQQFGHSSHGELGCDDCHGRDYRRYPHPEVALTDALSCLGCHREEPQAADYDLEQIDAEFAASVHAGGDWESASEALTCHDCHDPHAFRPVEVGEPLAAIVARHNRVCRSCHVDPDLGDADLTTRSLSIGPARQVPGAGPHAWLPHPQAHWEAVRCIDCHTPALGGAEHRVLPAAQAARRCVECHSRSARLLNDLYDYRSEEELARRGWLAKAVFNEAYIVGMSRNPALDRLSLFVLAVVILLLGAHGLGRYLASRAQRRKR